MTKRPKNTIVKTTKNGGLKIYFSKRDGEKLAKTIREKEDCLHNGCPECNGSGIKKDGSVCVHSISCSCKKCNCFSF